MYQDVAAAAVIAVVLAVVPKERTEGEDDGEEVVKVRPDGTAAETVAVLAFMAAVVAGWRHDRRCFL